MRRWEPLTASRLAVIVAILAYSVASYYAMRWVLSTAGVEAVYIVGGIAYVLMLVVILPLHHIPESHYRFAIASIYGACCLFVIAAYAMVLTRAVWEGVVGLLVLFILSVASMAMAERRYRKHLQVREG